jgi:hypothetical protein
MSTTDADGTIEEQLSRLLEHNAPAVTIEEIREPRPVSRVVEPPRFERRSAGPRPALVWTFALLLIAMAGAGIFIGVSSGHVRKVQIPATQTSRPVHEVGPSEARLSDQISLDHTRGVAGKTINGYLIVENKGPAINLTPRTRQVSGRTMPGCQPAFQVYLSNNKVTQTVAFSDVCSTAPFTIGHGTTRLPVTLVTTYTACQQLPNSDPTAQVPSCLISGEPPLPPGTYNAKVAWSQTVQLPNPKAVTVLLTAPKNTTTTTTTTTPPVETRHETFQPWSTTTSLAPGIRAIGSPSGGNCWTESIPDYDNPYAWRCLAANVIYDPCFAPPGATNVNEVACATTPTSGVYLLKLSTPLPQASSSRTPGPSYSWYVVLSNGQGCTRFDAAGPPTLDGVTLDFTCTVGAAAEPVRTTEPWTDRYAPSLTGPLQPVTVTEAWN